MPLAAQISAHLPQLRRFARLLAGSQNGGDAAVARVLQAILADPAIMPDLPVRLGLYQCFLQAFTNRLANNHDTIGLGATATRTLAALSPQARQAFLLVTVEDFTRAEAARILEVSYQRAERLLEEAGAVIGSEISTDALIIEDEPLIALDLQTLLTDLGHRVTSIARTHEDALRAALQSRPGLVIADVRLSDGSSGLDAVNDILSRFPVPVIFVTAYPESLTTGEKPEPTFLITKPFSPEAVKAIVSQVLFFDQQAKRRSPGHSSPTG